MTTETITAANITDAQIETLRDAAGQAGDSAQVDLCDAALAGDAAARATCAEVMEDARASRAEREARLA